MTITFEEYVNLASRTTSKESDLIEHYHIGLIGEVGEVADMIKKEWYHGHVMDKDELSKELGDVLWYLSQMYRVLKDTNALLRLPDLVNLNLSGNLNGYAVHAVIHLAWFVASNPIKHPSTYVNDVINVVKWIAKKYDLDMQNIARMNLEKLKKRYPNGFTQQASRERAE